MGDVKVDADGGAVEGVKRERAYDDVKPALSRTNTSDFWAELQAEASTSRSPSPDVGLIKRERNGDGPSTDASAAASRATSVSVPPVDPAHVNTPARRRKDASAKEPITRTLIDDLPLAWDDAHQTFDVLEQCVYETKKLGTSKEQDEMMVCDCVYDKRNTHAEQCGLHSDCVNRAIFIECLPHECRAKGQCRNQRFAKRQFADVEIVLTEMKGFGLRAGSDIQSGTLIYEYIGEVVAEKTFRKRMAAYADEGIRHFYFMMLQKEEYIDATKMGGIGRFANHSCAPNCEVQKWVVGRRLRMGIFAKRDILKGEEITFNYNVDRYGHDAQTCYCGEPNCVGTIGGKTQTDIGGLDDLFIDALGIADQVAAEGMKGSKKKKSRQLGEDFIPDLQPIEEHETQKVSAAIRQSMDKIRMMGFLLQRVQMTQDHVVHRQLVRMHGFSLMSMILTELAAERELVLLALQGMAKWKMQHLNKIADSNVQEPVKALAVSGDAVIEGAARELLDYWSTLELSYKIARVSKIDSLDADDEAQTHTIAETHQLPEHRRTQAWENTQKIEFNVAPVVYRAPTTFSRPAPPPPPVVKATPVNAVDRSKLDAIIALAQSAVPPHLTSTPGSHSPAETSHSSLPEDERRKRTKFTHDESSYGTPGSAPGANEPSEYERHLAEEEAMRKERKLMKMVGEHVVRSMNKYKEMMEHDTFKRYAKECTQILVDKEKRSASYASHRYSSLGDDKKAKIKAFTKEFVHKVLKRLKEKGKLRKPRSHGSSGRQRGNGSADQGSSSASASGARGGSMSTVPETPRGEGEGDGDGEDGPGDVTMSHDLDDIFGRDDDTPLVAVSAAAQTPISAQVEDGTSPGAKMKRVDTWTAVRNGSVGGGVDMTPNRTPGSL